MTISEYPFVLGTAGHIDHGKTSLVKALTGVDCDRLSEEKKRGITIELGFAPLELASGKIISIVDVPGHEKFIRQMVAGASGIDAAMLVIAADDGVMPQTREHLDILGLLGVKQGVVAVTKIDMLKDDERDEMTALLREDIEQLTRDTFLENAPLVFVSAYTGEGLPALSAALEKLVTACSPRDRSGAFFMPIDRAFGIKGAGSVVTGTGYTGKINLGDEVDVLPQEVRARVRSVQIHGAQVETAFAGQRTAINLSAVSLDALARGDVLCTPGRFIKTDCIDVALRILPDAAHPVEHWQRVHLHIGTTETVARVALLREKEIAPGGNAVAQLYTDAPVVAAWGESFVVRFFSPLVTIGGGTVLLPFDEKLRTRGAKTTRAELLEKLQTDFSPKNKIASLLSIFGMRKREELFALSQLDEATFRAAIDSLAAKGEVIPVGDADLMSRAKFAETSASITSFIDDFHRAHPELDGPTMDETASGIHVLDGKIVRGVLMKMEEAGSIVSTDATEKSEKKFHLPDFQKSDDETLRKHIAALAEIARERAFQLIAVDEISALLGIGANESKRAINFLKNAGKVKIIGDGMLLFDEEQERFISILQSVEGDITIGSVRDICGVSRKYTLPLLEYCDSIGVTRRVGEKRLLRKNKP